jgi:hypothetical protein
MAVQAEAPASGLVELRTIPAGPVPARHRFVEGQETLVIAPSTGAVVAVHVEAPPVGSVETSIVTGLVGDGTPPATHRLIEGQEMASSSPVAPAIGVVLHAPTPPVGSVDVTTATPGHAIPAVATQSDGDGQVTAPRPVTPLICVALQLVDPSRSTG